MVGDPCAINPDTKLRAHAREQGWRIRDYRTGRKAARAGLVAAAVAGARHRRGGRRGVAQGPSRLTLQALRRSRTQDLFQTTL